MKKQNYKKKRFYIIKRIEKAYYYRPNRPDKKYVVILYCIESTG